MCSLWFFGIGMLVKLNLRVFVECMVRCLVLNCFLRCLIRLWFSFIMCRWCNFFSSSVVMVVRFGLILIMVLLVVGVMEWMMLCSIMLLVRKFWLKCLCGMCFMVVLVGFCNIR